MARKERKEVDARFRNMSERDATKEYMQTLKGVYQEKGPLAAAGYEAKSTGYSIWKRLGNVSDGGVVSDGDAKYKGKDYPHPDAKTLGYHNYWKAKDAIARRTAERKAFILRDSKESKGLEATTAVASILGLVGGAFFLSANMTGNAIANYSTETTSLVGVLLFVIAVIAGVLWLSLRKEKKIVKKKRK